MNPVAIHRHVCSAHDDFLRRRFEGTGPQDWALLRAELLAWAKGLDSAAAFAGLLSILESERGHACVDAYQQLAGELLTKANVPCPLSLDEFMRRVLPLWNLSAAAVPGYVARV